jgi:branched-chain amino acid transport system ATP-binding protein
MSDVGGGTTLAGPAGAVLDGSWHGPRLACVHISVRFGGVMAVDDVGIEVPPGSIVGLVGPNGAGKSTLFGVLSGLVRPTRGRVYIEGDDVTRARPQVRAARGLARTFQHPELFAGLSVRDHLVLAYRVKHARRRTWSDLFTMGSLRRTDPVERNQVDELVELLGLGPIAHLPAMGLPLGTARLLEMGRALASSPSVLLLDEPSSGLDTSETEHFENTLRRVSVERGLSVLLVEHDVDLVMRLSSIIYVLDFGELIASGTPKEVHSSPQVQAAYLGEEVSGNQKPSAATVAPAAESSVAANLVPDPSGTQATTTSQDRALPPALAVEGLCVRYGEATALSGVSFEIGTGRALAILGANGAGKSSLARAVAGLVPPSEGSVRFAGREIRGWPAYRIRRAGIVYLPESRGIFPGLTVTENLKMAVATLDRRRARHDAMDRAFEMFPPLASRRHQLASLLSGGEQQMLSLGRALACLPRLLIADELSLGLAPMLVGLVFEALARAKQEGVTVIMIEQYVHRALELADDCLVLQRGEAAWNGPTTEARDEILRHYLGDALGAAD